MSVTSISLIQKLSLIFSRKAYLIYSKTPSPSLLVPLPQLDKTIKEAILKKFTDLTNDEILTFNHKNTEKNEGLTKIDIGEANFPHFEQIGSIENITVMPQSLFLTLNQQDSSLNFMKYQDIQSSILNAKKQKGTDSKETEKPKQQKVKAKQENKKTKKAARVPGQEEQFKDQEEFEHKQMSQWNQQAPQLATPPEGQPKEDISSLRTNKFVPLAILTEKDSNKPIEITHIQTSRQYLFTQMLKVFFVANILCVYGLVNVASRTENHEIARKRLE